MEKKFVHAQKLEGKEDGSSGKRRKWNMKINTLKGFYDFTIMALSSQLSYFNSFSLNLSLIFSLSDFIAAFPDVSNSCDAADKCDQNED